MSVLYQTHQLFFVCVITRRTGIENIVIGQRARLGKLQTLTEIGMFSLNV